MEIYDDEDFYDSPRKPPTPAVSDPQLKVIPKPEKEGLVEPVLLVGLEPSTELLEQIAGYNNPHYLVVVAPVRQQTYGTEVYHYYDQGKAYVFPVLKRQSQYVEFGKPGRNRIMACVVDIDRYNVFDVWKINHGRKNVVHSEQGFLVNFDGRYTPTSFVDIDLDQSVFAPEPTGWTRAVVDHVFDNRPFDECNFRKRLLISLVAEVFIQGFGLPVRVLTLLMAWVMLMYNQDYKRLFSLHVWDFWQHTSGSAWFSSRDGTERSYQSGWRYFLPWVSPPAILGYLAAFFLIPTIVYGVVNIPWDDKSADGRGNLADWGYWETYRITWFWIIVAAVGVAGLFGLYTLLRFTLGWLNSLRTKNSPRLKYNEEEWAALKAKEAKANAEREDAERRRRLEALRNGTVAIPIKGAIPESAQRGLWFKRLKRQVCRPYAG